MDETPIKAGRSGKGKMNAAWYWPIYGEADEIAFTYSRSKARLHIDKTLVDFKGERKGLDNIPAPVHPTGCTRSS